MLYEKFNGFVERIEGEIAHITLTSASGEVSWTEYPVRELAAVGIREKRKFVLLIGAGEGDIDVQLIPVAELVDEERERAIAREIEEKLGG